MYFGCLLQIVTSGCDESQNLCSNDALRIVPFRSGLIKKGVLVSLGLDHDCVCTDAGVAPDCYDKRS